MSDSVAVIGGGPAGLMAADILSAAGQRVVVYERMQSVGRKLLMAGRGGLNLTHSEPFERFVTRYRETAPQLEPILKAFTPDDLVGWANGLGAETFIGSSGRVFPKAMKASPLLRAMLGRLRDQGVEFQPSTQWTGWDEEGALTFASSPPQHHCAVLLALGGASWPKLGSDGGWRDILATRGVGLAPFKPSNVGFNVAWSEPMRRFAGEPLKNVAIRFGDEIVHGEMIVTDYGLEGGALYALSAPLRDAAPAQIEIDLRPRNTHADLEVKLADAKRGGSLASTLRKQLNLSPLAISLLRENGKPPTEPHALARLIKAVPLTLAAPRGLDRAISTAGGVRWDAVDATLQLRAIPNVYVAGEMLDWEAPTGGYLLQACFATGVWAARAILEQARALAAPGAR
ncbi:NAD(P)/FAD-dependent oxidoreductase [Terricaulis sp.]|uniref:NAD(P)/FAD-dependent oxidoreductase n=1 Tax=Terricaulis sp. TaxID=2768686 RepID=UPI0037850A48